MDKHVIETLLKTGETANVEFKGPMFFADDNRHELAKDIIAMANTQDGGTIIIGIEDNTNRVIGLSAEQVKSFDVTKINDFVKKYSSPLIRLECVPVTYIENCILVIIRVAEFESQPIIAKNCDSSKNKPVFREADILIRTEAAKSEPIREESSMRRLLSIALRRRSNELLKEVSLIISGATPRNSDETKENEIIWNKAEEHFREYLMLDREREQPIGTWSFICHPVSASIGNFVSSHLQLRDMLEQASVKRSSYNFPHVLRPRLRNSNFKTGNVHISCIMQDPAPELVNDAFSERYVLAGNMLFLAKRYMREDIIKHTLSAKFSRS